MNTNPYEAPRIDDDDEIRRAESPKSEKHFFRLPTVIEWIVIAGVVLVIVALQLPNVDEGSKETRQRLGAENAEGPGPQEAAKSE